MLVFSSDCFPVNRQPCGNHAPISFSFFPGCSGKSTVNAAANLEEYATKEENEKCFVRGNPVEMSGL